jgi:hypothetical protein
MRFYTNQTGLTLLPNLDLDIVVNTNTSELNIVDAARPSVSVLVCSALGFAWLSPNTVDFIGTTSPSFNFAAVRGISSFEECNIGTKRLGFRES